MAAMDRTCWPKGVSSRRKAVRMRASRGKAVKAREVPMNSVKVECDADVYSTPYSSGDSEHPSPNGTSTLTTAMGKAERQ